MTNDEILEKIQLLKDQAAELKKEVDFYNSLQLALKLVLNGSYGAFATVYFVLYNNYVASSITAQGRDLIQHMNKYNEEFWKNLWHLDEELHKKLCIRKVKQIKNLRSTIYCDTDSAFVSFYPAINHCEWKDIFYNNLGKLNKQHIVIYNKHTVKSVDNPNCLGIFKFDKSMILPEIEYIIVDGNLIKNRDFQKFIKDNNIEDKLKWNWSDELDFIQGIDNYRFAGYLKAKLEEYAASYGVINCEDFELEKISESAIHIAKKKYLHNIRHEDGVDYDSQSYIYLKGIELIRSSTPLFARERIMDIIKYLFKHPDDFNIKELLKIVKNLKKEFDLYVPDRIDEISMQSSCSNYEQYVLCDKDKLKFANKCPSSVKAAAYYNLLLNNDKEMQSKYEYLKSGSKIKYYYCKDKTVNKIFAFYRGSYPIEFAPDIDLDTQFAKSILSPINSIIEPLGLPEITQRLSVIMDIFGGTLKKVIEPIDETDDLEIIYDTEEKEEFDTTYYNDTHSDD